MVAELQAASVTKLNEFNVSALPSYFLSPPRVLIPPRTDSNTICRENSNFFVPRLFRLSVIYLITYRRVQEYRLILLVKVAQKKLWNTNYVALETHLNSQQISIVPYRCFIA